MHNFSPPVIVCIKRLCQQLVFQNHIILLRAESMREDVWHGGHMQHRV